MRLLVLVTDAYGGRGGIAKFNRDLLDSLGTDQRIHSIDVLPRVITEAVGPLPATLRFHTESARGRRSYVAALARMAASGAYDAVICGHLNLLPMAAALAARRRVPLICVIHGIEAWMPRGRVARALIRRATLVVSVSEFTRQRFLAWSRIEPARAVVIPNAVDLQGFTPGPKRPDLLDRYGLTGRTVLLTVARLTREDRYKGIDEVLDALPRVIQKFPDVAYLVVGDGDDRDRLSIRARDLGLDDRVVFAGYVAESEKVDHFRLADSFVMTGRGEGFGIVYLEALACGVPVVASSLDASREAVLDGALGEVANPDDPDTIVAAIGRALVKPRGTAPDALDHFSLANFSARWRTTMGKAVGSAKARS